MAAIEVGAVIARSILALAIMLSLLLVTGRLYWRHRSRVAALLLLAAACFVVVAAMHVFEAFSLFSAMGWGQPRSVGHYIDLGAAILGIALTSGAMSVTVVRGGLR